jgi:hypothetical protein
MKVILDSFKDSAHVLAEGFKVNGEKYTVIKSDDRSLWSKKVKSKKIVRIARN